MTTPILLTGATGNTGQVIADRLRGRGVPFVGMVRSEARKRQLAERGVESRLGDFDDPASLVPALEGIEVAYLVCTPDELLVPREVAFIRAAKQAGVRRIVKCSAFYSDLTGVSQNLRSHGAIEAELIHSGLEYTIVRPHGFMQSFTLFSWAMIERAGAMSMPAGDGGIPMLDARDVAEVAVRALVEPGHVGKAYDLTGPEILTMYDQAAILERVLGRPVTYIPGSERQLLMIMKLLGVPPTATEHVIKIFRMQREHEMEHTTNTLRELGITPITYEQFVRDLVEGKTGGGNSFEPPKTPLIRMLDAVMPIAMRAYLGIRGRERRAA